MTGYFHQASVLMPEPSHPGRARVCAQAGERTAHSRDTVKRRRRGDVDGVIALVSQMLRETLHPREWCPGFGVRMANACVSRGDALWFKKKENFHEGSCRRMDGGCVVCGAAGFGADGGS